MSIRPQSLHNNHKNRFDMRILIFALVFLTKTTWSINHCDAPVGSLSICTSVNNYDKSFPGDPITVYNSVTVLDIVELNHDDNTITLFVQIMVMWNDTRLTLTTSDKNV